VRLISQVRKAALPQLDGCSAVLTFRAFGSQFNSKPVLWYVLVVLWPLYLKIFLLDIC